jgi:hypothetical protein
MACEEVLGSKDLVELILSRVEMEPWTFVMCTRVSKVWRNVCHTDENLVLKAARAPRFLTKGVFCGLFGLTYAEAGVFPHGTRAHKTGFMYTYDERAIASVMEYLGGMCGRQSRLATRAACVARSVRNGERPWVALDKRRALCAAGNVPWKRHRIY